MVLSHGDFGNNHVIRDNKGVKIIDWEYASHRTILFDLYSCFLEQLFFKRVVPDLVEQINDAISLLEVNLAVKMPAITDGLLAMSEVYRWIFYIEQICSGMEFFDFSVKAKLKWIDAFNRFEEMQKYNHSRI
jgi:thiamine kinase-like enzyme